MSLRINPKFAFLTGRQFLAGLFYVGVVASFLIVPYYTYGRGGHLAWTFIWDIQESSSSGRLLPLVVLGFQYTFAFIILGYFFCLERFLKHQKEEFALAMTNLAVGFCRELLSGGGRFIEVNDGLLELLGYTQQEFFCISFKDLYSESKDYDDLRKLMVQKGSLIKEMRLKRKDGRSIWAMVSIRSVRNENGDLALFEYIVMDASERKWMEEEMASAYQRFESVIQNTPNIAIQGYGIDGKILEWNHASEVLYGYPSYEAIGRDGRDLFWSEEDWKKHDEIFTVIKETGRPAAPREWRLKNKYGKEVTVYSSMFPILQRGKTIEIFCMDVDISDRVETERRLSETKDKLESLALKDAMTEIYNFRYFRERLASEFERAKRTLSPLSVLMMDIDYFKSINDTYGHQFGDKILKQVARFLKTELRANDVVARWGGEEFAVILPETSRTDALSVATKLLDMIRARGFGDGTNLLKIKCSLGVVSYPEDPLFSVEELIDGAEESIYRVKERGGDGVALYGHEMGEKTAGQVSDDDRKRYIDSVKQKLSFFALRSERSILEAIYSLAKSIELRDRRTKEHCDRMVEYAEKVARRVGMNEVEVDNVRRASMLHDIGKLGISDAILLKPGRLTSEEYEDVKRHPVIGADIISVAGFLREIVPIILSHHERWDGKGYPRGLKGDEIPLGARVVAVVDVYEALTSDRPYHKAISRDEAIKIIREGMGTQFDERIVRAFLEIIA
jgi:diguanylate cyclase (GGDEF)-like protein/PAS domain S-box-containing protein/putative nucleotidyltransferase with HDIG domain